MKRYRAPARSRSPLAAVLVVALPAGALGSAGSAPEPWVLAALEAELAPRFSAVLGAAARQAGRGPAVLGVWAPEGDDCRSGMVAFLPGDRPDGFQEWRRVAPGETMAPVRVGRWQEQGAQVTLSIGLVADPAGLDPRGGSGTAFRPLEERNSHAARDAWPMAQTEVQERWTRIEATAERLRLRQADGTELVLARCRVVVFRPDGRPAEAVIP